jgi:broad specificity phosphatase PhoE
MKTVYFIRHGQSTGNSSIWEQQGPHTDLTPHGRQQAETVAKHLKRFPIQALIVSTFARTRATAEPIARELELVPEYSELFVEHRRPGVQIRKQKMHPHWLWTQLQLTLFSRFSAYRHSDEETPGEILERAHAALRLLEERPEDIIAVVTHARFMRALYVAMGEGEAANGKTYLRMIRTHQMRNTALMIAEHDTKGWDVKAWNVDAQSV